MGLLDKRLKLGKLSVPVKELRTYGFNEKDFICVGDTKEAACDLIQYAREMAQIKKDEADWDALVAEPKYDELNRPSLRWQLGLQYMGNLLEEWRVRMEALIDDIYSKGRPQITVRYLIEAEKESGCTQELEEALADTLANVSDVGALIDIFPETLEWGQYGASGDWGYLGTLPSNTIVWVLPRLSDLSATAALSKLRQLEVDEKPVFGVLWPNPKLSDMAVKKDVDAVCSWLDGIYSYTKNILEHWEVDIGKPPKPWETSTWGGMQFKQSTRREWGWAMYIIEQWGDERVLPVLERIYPLLDFWKRARVKRIINKLR